MQLALRVTSVVLACGLMFPGAGSCESSATPLRPACPDTLITVAFPEIGATVYFPVEKALPTPGVLPVSTQREKLGFEPFSVKVDITARCSDPRICVIGLATAQSLAAFDAAACDDCPFKEALDPGSLEPQRAALSAGRAWRDYRFVQCGSSGYLTRCEFYESSSDFLAEYLTFVGQGRISIAVSSKAAALRERTPPVAFEAICDSLGAPFDSLVTRVKIDVARHSGTCQ